MTAINTPAYSNSCKCITLIMFAPIRMELKLVHRIIIWHKFYLNTCIFDKDVIILSKQKYNGLHLRKFANPLQA